MGLGGVLGHPPGYKGSTEEGDVTAARQPLSHVVGGWTQHDIDVSRSSTTMVFAVAVDDSDDGVERAWKILVDILNYAMTCYFRTIRLHEIAVFGVIVGAGTIGSRCHPVRWRRRNGSFQGLVVAPLLRGRPSETTRRAIGSP